MVSYFEQLRNIAKIGLDIYDIGVDRAARKLPERVQPNEFEVEAEMLRTVLGYETHEPRHMALVQALTLSISLQAAMVINDTPWTALGIEIPNMNMLELEEYPDPIADMDQSELFGPEFYFGDDGKSLERLSELMGVAQDFATRLKDRQVVDFVAYSVLGESGPLQRLRLVGAISEAGNLLFAEHISPMAQWLRVWNEEYELQQQLWSGEPFEEDPFKMSDGEMEDHEISGYIFDGRGEVDGEVMWDSLPLWESVDPEQDTHLVLAPEYSREITYI